MKAVAILARTFGQGYSQPIYPRFLTALMLYSGF